MQLTVSKKEGDIIKNLFFWQDKNVILSPEHHSVVQKQGSRDSTAERCLHAEKWKIYDKSIPKPTKNQWEIVAKTLSGKLTLQWRETDRNGTSKWTLNHEKGVPKQCPEIHVKNHAVPGAGPGPGGGICSPTPGGPWVQYINRYIHVYK